MVWRWMKFQGSHFIGFVWGTEFEMKVTRRDDGYQYFQVDSYQRKDNGSELASVPGFKKRGN